MLEHEKTELRQADRTVGVNYNIFYPIFRQARPNFLRVCLQHVGACRFTLEHFNKRDE